MTCRGFPWVILVFKICSFSSGSESQSNEEFEEFQEWQESDANEEWEVAADLRQKLHERELLLLHDVINAQWAEVNVYLQVKEWYCWIHTDMIR